MNERITLLALKASDPKTGWLDRQMFAELIVRECMSYMEDGDIDFAKFMIKKNFGGL
jgi:hypothetical protein